MPKIEIDGELIQLADCPDCGRTVMVDGKPCTGWVASCGKRLVNLSECGQATDICYPETPSR